MSGSAGGMNGDDALRGIGAAEEVGISSRRTDGSWRPDVTIWSVVTDGGVYVRSAYGAENGWYRRLLASGAGRLSAGSASAEFTPAHPDDGEEAAVDAEYLAKYARYPGIVRGIVGPDHYATTLRLDPVEEER